MVPDISESRLRRVEREVMSEITDLFNDLWEEIDRLSEKVGSLQKELEETKKMSRNEVPS